MPRLERQRKSATLPVRNLLLRCALRHAFVLYLRNILFLRISDKQPSCFEQKLKIIYTLDKVLRSHGTGYIFPKSFTAST
jgi:hypothetical protein